MNASRLIKRCMAIESQDSVPSRIREAVQPSTKPGVCSGGGGGGGGVPPGGGDGVGCCKDGGDSVSSTIPAVSGDSGGSVAGGGGGAGGIGSVEEDGSGVSSAMPTVSAVPVVSAMPTGLVTVSALALPGVVWGEGGGGGVAGGGGGGAGGSGSIGGGGVVVSSAMPVVSPWWFRCLFVLKRLFDRSLSNFDFTVAVRLLQFINNACRRSNENKQCFIGRCCFDGSEYNVI
jgi:hypothetical protein